MEIESEERDKDPCAIHSRHGGGKYKKEKKKRKIEIKESFK